MSAGSFANLPLVHASVAALYRRLGARRMASFASSVLPAEVAFGDEEDLVPGVQRVVGVLAARLGLPWAPVGVRLRTMPEAGWVELDGAGPGYVVELHERYATRRRDIGAVLAHEVTHVFLHRAGLSFPATADNEVLTDTAAAYLGVGWLLLDAFRQDALSSQRLGYLTPQEYGYVLAKRAGVFGEDPRVWFTSPQADEAYRAGAARARRDWARPPLAGVGWAARRGYATRRAVVLRGLPDPGAAGPAGDGGYAFEPGPPRVAFDCPVCFQRLRLPVSGPLRARCAACDSVLDCET